jgi:tryptophanyl-tRNA synthetase
MVAVPFLIETKMSEQTTTPAPKRVLSGMRPTGRLHLGNYMGALKNWVELQNATNEDGTPKYECFFFIADFHALTTDYADTSKLRENVIEVAFDFLAAGLDPNRSTIFVQSHVTAHFQLNDLLGMITPVSWLERVPTYKDQQEQLKEKDLATFGFLGYPLLQSADILAYQAHFVPVGQDQAAHVEITREIARRFNSFYSPKRLVGTDASSLAEEPDPERLILPEPQVLLTPSPKLPGIDGRKMSKSYGNSILLSEHPAFILEKMSRMTNGGQRNPQSLPGDPDRCPVGDMHTLFSDLDVRNFTRTGCVEATIACATCKQMAAGSIITKLHEIRKKREKLERVPNDVWDILEEGGRRASARAEQTMEQVREVTGLSRKRPAFSTHKRPHDANESSRAGHSLVGREAWWDQEPGVRSKNIRHYWLANLLPSEIKLTQDSDRVFITRKQKRVYVTTSREMSDGRWGFEAKPKSYEMLALLCWDKQLRLHDFIIPQIAYQIPWTAYKKAHKNEDILFWIRCDDAKYFLELPEAAPIEITDYRGQYQPMS